VLANPEAQSLDASLRDGGQVLSTYDNHPADLGDTTFAREKGLGLRGSAHERLARIAEARERLAQGRYGRCTRCGAAIPEGLLKAMPWTATCAPCAEAEGARRARRRALGASPWPVRPPFGQGPEEGQQPVEGDGEDIWHEVARYGTSSRGPVPPEPPADRPPFLPARGGP
jgi:RNA polymerase-binding transcription factor DksA